MIHKNSILTTFPFQMISDEEDLPETRPGSVVQDDELPETDPEDENSSKDADSPVRTVGKKKTVTDEDYDSFDDFDDFEPTQSQAKSSSSSEDSEAGDDSEYVHEPETQETQPLKRTYSLRGQKEVVELVENDPEDGEDIEEQGSCSATHRVYLTSFRVQPRRGSPKHIPCVHPLRYRMGV